MRPFVVEIYWPDMTAELVAGLVARTTEAAANDSAIRYVGCEMAPRDETCFLRVAAEEPGALRAFVDALGLESARVTELVDVPPRG